MTSEHLSPLQARDDLQWIADSWQALAACLRPGNSHALTGLTTHAGGGNLPINVHVSDLMREIDTQLARFYATILLAEIPPVHGCEGACHGSPEHTHTGRCLGIHIPADQCHRRRGPITATATPDILEQIATHAGHFADEKDPLAWGYCDDAAEYRRRVHHVLQRPDPPAYIGPCQTRGCPADLYVHPEKQSGHCPECGREWDRANQVDWIYDQLDNRLMTQAEIVSALVTLDLATPENTVKSWVHRKKLRPTADGLYRLAHAYDLAQRRHARLTLAS